MHKHPGKNKNLIGKSATKYEYNKEIDHMFLRKKNSVANVFEAHGKNYLKFKTQIAMILKYYVHL